MKKLKTNKTKKVTMKDNFLEAERTQHSGSRFGIKKPQIKHLQLLVSRELAHLFQTCKGSGIGRFGTYTYSVYRAPEET